MTEIMMLYKSLLFALMSAAFVAGQGCLEQGDAGCQGNQVCCVFLVCARCFVDLACQPLIYHLLHRPGKERLGSVLIRTLASTVSDLEIRSREGTVDTPLFRHAGQCTTIRGGKCDGG